MCSSEVMTAREPPPSTKRSAASTLGPMLPRANCPAAACSRNSAAVTRPSGRADGVPKSTITFGTSVAITRVSASISVARMAAVRSLSMTASTPRSACPSCLSSMTGMPPPPAQTTTKPAAASAWMAGGSKTDSGSGEATTRRPPRWPPASPATLTPVLPDLAERDEPFRLLAREEPADGLRGLLEVRVVGVDEGAGDQAGGALREAACLQGGVELVGQGERDRGLGLGHAPVQRHRRDLVRGELVLPQQVPDLRPVAVGQDHIDAGGHDVGDVPRGNGDRVALRPGGGRAVRSGHRVATEGDDDATNAAISSGLGRAHPEDPSGKVP